MLGRSMAASRRKIELTQEYLKEVLHYDPETGIFTWRSSGKGRKLGRPAGALHKKLGSVQLFVGGRLYYAHRLAWLYMTGSWPREHIDHIDGDPSNNRWVNLREATNAENLQNQRHARKDNLSSGLLGVTWHKQGRKFMAQISVDEKRIYLGLHETAQEAHQAYLKAKRELHPFGVI